MSEEALNRRAAGSGTQEALNRRAAEEALLSRAAIERVPYSLGKRSEEALKRRAAESGTQEAFKRRAAESGTQEALNRRAAGSGTRGIVALVAWLAGGSAYGAADVGPGSAPRTEFTPLRAGTYQLQSIQPVREATLLDERGKPVKLSTLTQGKVTLLTFFYTYCVDPLGCPFLHETQTQLRARILADKALAGNVRFVNISCDPTHDTPEALSKFATSFHTSSPFEWRFITTPAVPALLPVLNDFGQDVSVELDKQGQPTRTLHHMLKAFLIDTHGTVREIYTLAFIQPDVMLNDIRTLHMEQSSATSLVQR